MVINRKKESIEREENTTNSINQLNQNNVIISNIQNINIYGANVINNNIPSQNHNRKEKLIIPYVREANNIFNPKNPESTREKDNNINHTPKTNSNSKNNNVNNPNNNNNFLNENPINNNLYNNLYQNIFTNLNIASNHKNLKDLNEYMETHKMLIELEKVQNDELEEVEYPEINDYREEYLEENRKMIEEFSIDEDNNIVIPCSEDKNMKNNLISGSNIKGNIFL